MVDSTINKAQLDHIVQQYGVDIKSYQYSPLGNGHINTTFLIQSATKSFVLQRINHHVFKQPEHIIENANLISDHLAKQTHYPLENIFQLKTATGKSSTKHGNDTWRALNFIEQSYTVEQVDTTEQAKQVATAFAHFSGHLEQFDAKKLHDVIPNFHNIVTRLQQLDQAIKDCKNDKRLARAKDSINFCHDEQSFIDEVINISAVLPLYVTHNDTKISNLLFSSQTKQPVAVIDLDTCMSGFLMNDFGDMVRTCCSSLTEDATDIENMTFKADIFNALYSAYNQALVDKITPLEQQSLLIGAKLFPFIMAVRFLTDYINGDIYYTTTHASHNIERAANQFKLYKLACVFVDSHN
jgi:Ser/Thr protein kinase RdoA (MazF antagonist)